MKKIWGEQNTQKLHQMLVHFLGGILFWCTFLGGIFYNKTWLNMRILANVGSRSVQCQQFLHGLSWSPIAAGIVGSPRISRGFDSVFSLPLPRNQPKETHRNLRKQLVFDFGYVKITLRHQKLTLPKAQVARNYGTEIAHIPCRNYSTQNNSKIISVM